MVIILKRFRLHETPGRMWYPWFAWNCTFNIQKLKKGCKIETTRKKNIISKQKGKRWLNQLKYHKSQPWKHMLTKALGKHYYQMRQNKTLWKIVWLWIDWYITPFTRRIHNRAVESDKQIYKEQAGFCGRKHCVGQSNCPLESHS